jgi:hypothetical protein
VRTQAISTGAKHLAIDMSKMSNPIEKPNVTINNKPQESEFECFGCSS